MGAIAACDAAACSHAAKSSALEAPPGWTGLVLHHLRRGDSRRCPCRPERWLVRGKDMNWIVVLILSVAVAAFIAFAWATK
jgi:hypothetical protein